MSEKGSQSTHIEKKVSRREFLKFAGVVLAAGATGVLGYVLGEGNRATEPTSTLTPTPEPTATTEPTVSSEGTFFTPAEKNGDQWVLYTSDGDPVTLSLPDGYTPDGTLKISSDVHPQNLLPVPKDAAKFQEYLNNRQGDMGALAGFTDSINDYNQYYNHASGPQLPAYSWEVFTGSVVEIPGIGRVEGGRGRAAMILILNRTDRVYRWPMNSVHVEAGFLGWGRIWNGEAPYVQETEKRLVQHFLTRLGQGVPETGFIGQCDQGARNCDEVTVVSAERIQWGNNSDGTPRFQFRLIRVETVPAAK